MWIGALADTRCRNTLSSSAAVRHGYWFKYRMVPGQDIHITATGYSRPRAAELKNYSVFHPQAIRLGNTTVEVEFSTAYRDDYKAGNSSGPLWAKKQRAVYTGDARRGKLILDSVRSDVTGQEIEEIYENDVLHCGDIFKYNFTELKGIAAGRSAQRKTWLREYLNQCKDGPEKQELEQLLKKSSVQMGENQTGQDLPISTPYQAVWSCSL